MVCVPVGASRGLRWGCLILAAIVALLALTTDPADARGAAAYLKRSHATEILQPALRRHRGRRQHRRGTAPTNADAPRHPASLTKIMTLYLLFERLEAGQALARHADAGLGARRVPGAVQARAASPARPSPSKTRSRRWSPARPTTPPWSVAETLGGGEEEFARAMTRKARALGMRTPSTAMPPACRTTAGDHGARPGAARPRDPGALPELLPLFLDRELRVPRPRHRQPQPPARAGRRRRRHQDRLHRASGFNLVTSVKRGAEHIVAVVLGGRGPARDARMRDLIDSHIAGASTRDTVSPSPRRPNPRPPRLRRG